MKYLLSLPIILYQTFFPKKYRGECLFKESCSNHVLRITNEKGFFEGLRALKFRHKNCRPGYVLSSIKGRVVLISVANIVFEEEDIDSRVLEGFEVKKENSY